MRKYLIKVTNTRDKIVEVSANTQQEAMDKVQQAYCDMQIMLTNCKTETDYKLLRNDLDFKPDQQL